jgi:hypothetical protein
VVEVKLLASAESYDDAGGTPEDYIDAMYELVLGRPGMRAATRTGSTASATTSRPGPGATSS